MKFHKYFPLLWQICIQLCYICNNHGTDRQGTHLPYPTSQKRCPKIRTPQHFHYSTSFFACKGVFLRKTAIGTTFYAFNKIFLWSLCAPHIAKPEYFCYNKDTRKEGTSQWRIKYRPRQRLLSEKVRTKYRPRMPINFGLHASDQEM